MGRQLHGRRCSAKESGPVLFAQFTYLSYQTMFWVSAGFGSTPSLLSGQGRRTIALQNLGHQDYAEDLM